MQSLKEVISALCEEIDEALSKGNRRAQGHALVSERIVLSLEIAMREHSQEDGRAKPVFEVVSSAVQGSNGSGYRHSAKPEPGRHHITLELKPAGGEITSVASSQATAAEPSKAASPSPEQASPLTGREADEVAESLSEVFGAPGFDSAARASVFREALAELDEAKARAVVEALTQDMPPDSEHAMQQAHHVARNVLLAGPQKSIAAGAEILSPLFRRYAVSALLELIEARWKSQMDWLEI